MTNPQDRPVAETLREISKRADKATPGPWVFRSLGGTNQESPEPPEYWAVDPRGNILAADHYPGDGRDVEFIAHAREDIPFLLSVIERLSAPLEVTDAKVEEMADAVWFEFTQAGGGGWRVPHADRDSSIWERAHRAIEAALTERKA